MKKLISVLLIAAMLLGLCACSGDDNSISGAIHDQGDSIADIIPGQGATEAPVGDPTLGLYQGHLLVAQGREMRLSDLYPGENSLELKDGGSCVLILGGTTLEGTWTLADQNLSLTLAGVSSSGTLSGGVASFDYMGSGVIMSFVKTTGENTTDTPSTGTGFPEAFIAEHEGDWHGMAVVYEGTGAFADEKELEMEIIGRLVFLEDGSCLPYLACAFGGKDNNFKNLNAAYSEAGDVMMLYGEFVNAPLVDSSSLFVLDGALYVDVYVDDGKGNTMNLYGCLRRLDESWDYENDWLNLPQAAVDFYKGKSFLEIAELFQVDVSEIPELENASTGTAGTDDPVSEGKGIADFETIAEVYDWVLDYSSAANGYQKIPYEEIVRRMGGVEGEEVVTDFTSDTNRFYKWSTPDGEYIQLTFRLEGDVWIKCGATNSGAFMDIYKKYHR